MAGKNVLFRSAYKSHLRVTHPDFTPEKGSHVKQEFKKQVDINEIFARMKRGQQPPSWMTANTPRYGDFTKGPQNLMEAYDVVARAEEAFLSLPVEFRREIDHDPRNLASAPKELWERFGLLKQKGPSAGPEVPKAPTPPTNDKSPANGKPGGKKGPVEGPSNSDEE